ncbi:SEC-C metal-binding domain-containing protein [Vibrio parahaemolyticus]|uniref:SEC-C metal-binding domain-containing protein n=1 Tax=Vibrio parahaemolyticus TaxID=670 RepID=UPI00298FDAB8|nr:SEC-C metal-binding domain-containing protein [Vibrio parahaemolyticus]MDW9225144.1 SEC-C metal-binding domain-containing protein [Vibrio parahaemolyticus]
MNKSQTHELKAANLKAIESESMQSEVYTDDEIIHIIEQALKPANRNRPCICGSGKKYKKCCRGGHLVKFNQFKNDLTL